ncbi:MAG: hypothetical protein ACI4JK_07795 [Oscillospiraceae bacterium]
MAVEKSISPFQVVVLITTPKLARKANALFQEGSVPIQYLFHAKGTASNEILDLLGLGNIEKTVIVSMMPKTFANKILEKLQSELKLGTTNSGIVFSSYISAGNAQLLKILQQMSDNHSNLIRKDEKSVHESKYSMIATVANQGYSEEVMNAARTAGATGGTIINSRRIIDENTMKFWGLSVQQEKEIIMILAKAEDKLGIMNAIHEKCGLQSEAKGIVFSMPIDNIMGLNETEHKVD